MNIENKKSFSKQNYGEILKLLDIDNYKTKICKNSNKHNKLKCFYFHNKFDKRRNLNIFKYMIILCKNINNCSKKDYCEYSHNKIEILYHSIFYKKKFCEKFLLDKGCPYDEYCSFAHSEKELRIEIIHYLPFDNNFFLFKFKTVFCPLGNINHNKVNCIYAHNFQDYKREILFNINPFICKNWNLKQNYQNYIEGCKNGVKCKYLHGWKEINFHPLIYKSKVCKYSFKDCKYNSICHFYHSNIEKILVPEKNLIYIKKNN